jgi:hypothetical protein
MILWQRPGLHLLIINSPHCIVKYSALQSFRSRFDEISGGERCPANTDLILTGLDCTMDPASRRVPLDKRKRTETSCDRCKTRKQRCDRLSDKAQCRYCELHGITCTTSAPRKRRIFGSVEGIGNRMSLLESLIKGLLPEADLSSIEEMQQLGRQLGIPLPTLEEGGLSNGTQTKNIASKDDEDNAIQVLPDQQNQIQYVGPSSSFLFHLRLRRMLGNYPTSEFAMFGNNAADQIFEPSQGNRKDRNREPHQTLPVSERRHSSKSASDCASPSDAIRDIDGSVLETLLDAYFDVIHSDLPVLHEASFREAYETWSTSNSTADPAWLCGLLCVLILARRVANIEIPEEAEKKWWRHVQTLMPTVFFSSNLFTVQTLMLAALHLHNNSHRDACWNLTGTAVRVAHGIGLHRDDIKQSAQSPLGRELRKQVWWSLYAFEQMQVSSYDRPSAIAHIASTVGTPNERIVGTAGPVPPDFAKWSQKLHVFLGSACKALNPAGNGGMVPPDDAYSRPLSPTAAILRDLERWKESLPPHLRLEIINASAPTSQRPLILLHVQYYYILVLVTRSALLRRAMILARSPGDQPLPQALVAVSETCIDAGRSLGQLLWKLDDIQKFNAVTWFDIFYLVAAVLTIVLDLRIKQDGRKSPSEPKILLSSLAAVAAKHMQNPRMPGSMRALAQIVVDVNLTAENFSSDASVDNELQSGQSFGGAPQMSTSPGQYSPHNQHVSSTPKSFPLMSVKQDDHLITGGDEIALVRGHTDDPKFWEQLSFMDDGTLQDWTWDDIGTIVRAR